ncbi:hypothetical protein FACS189413_04370 [Bacteroidia bacterium]|nr:hypothetical protein FACS189413_04370 [Bacteroidia bacterium]
MLLIRYYEAKLAKNNSWIGHNADIPYIPCFPHGISGIFISNEAKIGKNVVIFQQVTIGSNTLNKANKFGSPKIGDNVYIGAGAKIIGNIKIGNNCRIGANAVVYTDLPDNSVAVQAPTRIIRKENLDNKYFTERKNKWIYYDNGQWKESDTY